MLSAKHNASHDSLPLAGISKQQAGQRIGALCSPSHSQEEGLQRGQRAVVWRSTDAQQAAHQRVDVPVLQHSHCRLAGPGGRLETWPHCSEEGLHVGQAVVIAWEAAVQTAEGQSEVPTAERRGSV